jgi:Holliday junction resolvase-like predicted endonuclease
MYPLSKEQYGFLENNRVLAYNEIDKMFNKKKTLVTIDMKNAFNSISQKAIVHALRNRGCPVMVVKYIELFMQTRFCRIVEE